MSSTDGSTHSIDLNPGQNGTEGTNPSIEMMDFPMESSSPMMTPNTEGDNDSGLFFADATLDLNEAHDIAETPEVQRPILASSSMLENAPRQVELPQLNPDTLPAENQVENQVSPTSSVPSTSITSSAAAAATTTTTMGRIDGGARAPTSNTYRPKPPRRPRDIPWMVGFILFVPIGLLISTFLRTNHDHASPVALSRPSQHNSIYALIITGIVSQVFCRLLYRTVGGGDGDDARHIISQILLSFAPISIGIYALLIMCIFLKTPRAVAWSLIPLWFLGKDLFAMRRWRTTASTAGGRQAFFSAIVNTALDILSRSLRRSSFYRFAALMMVVQFVAVMWWRSALLGALRRGSTFWILVALFTGKWITGFVARLLGLVASGGVTSWFVQQSIMVEELQAAKEEQQGAPITEAATMMPEEYRSADASAYQPVIDLDDGIDDDYEDEDRQNNAMFWSDTNSNVMSFVKTGITISFGSVAQCGLLGGVAQFAWSVLRNMDSLATAISQRFNASRSGFQGMMVGGYEDGPMGLMHKILVQINAVTRTFVRNHSDLALCHVAAYYKGYQRAAQDVAVLVDSSGVEPIIHDDITTHMCASLCGTISGAVIMIFGLYLNAHRGRTNNHLEHLDDDGVVKSMLVTFILSYTLIFTVMEPLRASIKAIYVCFAQHPHSLSQAFPLIFSRLTRISEANILV